MVNETSKPYKLNADKALEKKRSNCNTEHLQTIMKQNGNFRMYMSTAAYELTKAKLPVILKNYTDNECLAITIHRGLDLNIAEVDTRFRVLNQLKTGKPGNKLKFTINCYHTSTSILVNGSKLNLFIENILPKLKEAINANCSNLNELNYRIENSIVRNIQQCQTEHQQIAAKIPQSTTKTKECEQSYQIVSNTNDNIQTEVENIDICPVCQKQADDDTIECEECNDWLHFECVGLTKTQVQKIDHSIPYICKQCIENQLYQLPKDMDNTIDVSIQQQSVEQEPNQDSTPQSARAFPSYTGTDKDSANLPQWLNQ